MGKGTPWGFDLPGAGPDGVFGNADDVDKHFGADPFTLTEPFEGVGVNDTLDNTAWALSTGKVPVAQANAVWAAAVDMLMANQKDRQPSSDSAPVLMELVTLYSYE